MAKAKIDPTTGQKIKGQVGGKREGAGRPTLFTPEIKKKLIMHLEEGLPREVCAQLCRMHPETLRLHLIKDADYLAEIEQAEAIGIRLLAEMVKLQTGAWKLLKNVGKKYYKENIDLTFDESKPITLAGDDGEDDELI